MTSEEPRPGRPSGRSCRSSPSSRSCSSGRSRGCSSGALAPSTAPTASTGAPWRELLTTPLYRDALLRTFRLSLTVTLACLVLGYPVAYALARARGWRGQLLLALVVAPFWISVLARSFTWMVLLQRQGVVNRLLLALGHRAGAGAPRLQRGGRPHRDDPRPAAVHDPVPLRRHARASIPASSAPRPGSGPPSGRRSGGSGGPSPGPASARAACSCSWSRSDSSSRPRSSGAGR